MIRAARLQDTLKIKKPSNSQIKKQSTSAFDSVAHDLVKSTLRQKNKEQTYTKCCPNNNDVFWGLHNTKPLTVKIKTRDLSIWLMPERYSQKNFLGVCSWLPKTLALFMAKICDFPYQIYDLTKMRFPIQGFY